MARKPWLGLTIKDIYQIAINPNVDQIKYQKDFVIVYDALTKPKAEYPVDRKKEMKNIRKQYLRNAQSGRRNMARSPEFIAQGADIHARNMAIANSRPKRGNEEIDWDFWMNPEFLKD